MIVAILEKLVACILGNAVLEGLENALISLSNLDSLAVIFRAPFRPVRKHKDNTG